MVNREFATFVSLGGKLCYLDIIEARVSAIKQCDAFCNMSPNTLEMATVLDKTALMTIAQDQAHLITLLIKIQQALNDDNVILALFYIDCAFI